MNKTAELTKQIIDHMKGLGSENTKVRIYKDCWSIEVERSGGLGKVATFATMKWLSELLNTEKIDIKDQHHTPGCDTCDYGSTDSASLVCYDVRIPGLGD